MATILIWMIPDILVCLMVASTFFDSSFISVLFFLLSHSAASLEIWKARSIRESQKVRAVYYYQLSVSLFCWTFHHYTIMRNQNMKDDKHQIYIWFWQIFIKCQADISSFFYFIALFLWDQISRYLEDINEV